MKAVGVGLVAFNMTPLLIERLSASLGDRDFAYKVVVDNSPDTQSKSHFERFGWHYVSCPENPGFGTSHNRIFKAFGHLATFHVVVNPDISFTGEVLEDLALFMASTQDCGAVAPAVYYPNGDFQELRKLLPSPLGWFMRRFLKGTQALEAYNERFELRMAPRKGVFKIPYMSGCFMMLRSSAIRQIGFFDEKIFMYGEDTDLSRRLWNYGAYPYYMGEVCITHDFAKGSHKSTQLLLVAIRSTIYYFTKWGWIDPERDEINEQCLSQFGGNRSDSFRSP